MKFKGALVLSFLLLFGVFYGTASDDNSSHKARVSIPDVALLSLQFERNSGIEFLAEPKIAGDIIHLNTAEKSAVWLNYSSVSSNNKNRKVTATVAGSIPEGIIVKVKAGQSTGAGVGMLGKSNGLVRLSESPTDVVSGIGSCYTGSGAQNGHLLSYELEIDEDLFYKNSESKETTLQVVYTLTDDN
jgi:hypothetical protein